MEVIMFYEVKKSARVGSLSVLGNTKLDIREEFCLALCSLRVVARHTVVRFGELHGQQSSSRCDHQVRMLKIMRSW